MNGSDQEIYALASKLGEHSLQKGISITTAESCTGGWLAESLTSVPGSSGWFERGFVTYSNIAKQEMLGVTPKVLQEFGAVSKQVALEMANGALTHSHAQLSLSITGIAGPDGGTVEKPVGTVCFSAASSYEYIEAITKTILFHGERYEVRRQAVITAMQILLEMVVEIKAP